MNQMLVPLCLLGLLAGIIDAGEDKIDCAAQYKDTMQCHLDIKESKDVQMVWDKKKQILKEICVPDYPKSCIQDWENLMACCKELSEKSKDDSEFKGLIEKASADVNKCFATQPSNPFKEMEEIFMNPFIKAMIMQKVEGGKKNSSSSKSKESAEDDSDEDDYLPTPPPDMKFRPECIPKPKQMHCVKSSLIKAFATDPVFRAAVDNIMKKKDECDLKIKRQCELTTPELMKCFWDSHKDVFKSMFPKVTACMKGKGGSGGEKKGD